MMSVPDHEFPLHVLKELESFFEEGRITTLAERASLNGPKASAVKIIDSKTGAELLERRFDSQVKNKVAALLTLLKNEREQEGGVHR